MRLQRSGKSQRAVRHSRDLARVGLLLAILELAGCAAVSATVQREVAQQQDLSGLSLVHVHGDLLHGDLRVRSGAAQHVRGFCRLVPGSAEPRWNWTTIGAVGSLTIQHGPQHGSQDGTAFLTEQGSGPALVPSADWELTLPSTWPAVTLSWQTGVGNLDLDLTGSAVQVVEVQLEAGDVSLVLGPSHGPLAVRVRSGAGVVRVTLPPDQAAEVRLGEGAWKLFTVGLVGNEDRTVWFSPGLGQTGRPTGPAIILTIELGAGEIFLETSAEEGGQPGLFRS